MHSKIFEATDENDLEVAMVVSLGGTHIEKDEEERSARTGIYLGEIGASESYRSNFETNSVANRIQMQIRKNRFDVAEPRFLCDNSRSSFLWLVWIYK